VRDKHCKKASELTDLKLEIVNEVHPGQLKELNNCRAWIRLNDPKVDARHKYLAGIDGPSLREVIVVNNSAFVLFCMYSGFTYYPEGGTSWNVIYCQLLKKAKTSKRPILAHLGKRFLDAN